MAVTRRGNTISFTANGDTYPGIVFLKRLVFHETSGLTPGDLIKVTEATATNPDVIAQGYVTAAAGANVDLLGGVASGPYGGMKVTAPAAGVWELIAHLE